MIIKKKNIKIFLEKNKINLFNKAHISLKDNEFITFIEKKKIKTKQYDVVKKNWGYYATPSINKRLKFYGYSTVIIKNLYGKYFVCIVNEDKIRDFYQYLKNDRQKIVLWLKKSNLDLLEKINK
jgi:hypothetical protein